MRGDPPPEVPPADPASSGRPAESGDHVADPVPHRRRFARIVPETSNRARVAGFLLALTVTVAAGLVVSVTCVCAGWMHGGGAHHIPARGFIVAAVTVLCASGAGATWLWRSRRAFGAALGTLTGGIAWCALDVMCASGVR